MCMKCVQQCRLLHKRPEDCVLLLEAWPQLVSLVGFVTRINNQLPCLMDPDLSTHAALSESESHATKRLFLTQSGESANSFSQTYCNSVTVCHSIPVTSAQWTTWTPLPLKLIGTSVCLS